MTCDSQEKLIARNALFKENDVTIAKRQQHLKEQLSRTLVPSELSSASCQELGGSDDDQRNIQSNKVLQKFDAMLQYDMLPPSPPSSTTMELSEITLYHDTDDTTRTNDDDDTLENVAEAEHDLKEPNSKDDMTKKNSLGPFGVVVQRRQLGLGMGYPFLSSYLSTLGNNKLTSDKEYEANQVMLTSLTKIAHHETTAMEGSTQTTAMNVIPDTLFISGDSNDERQLLPLSSLFGKSLCWLIFYIFLRIPLESIIYRQLMVWMDPRHVLTSTIGITAGMAMVIGTLIQTM